MLLKRVSFYIRLKIRSTLKPGFEPPALCQEQIHFALIENILFINYRRKKGLLLIYITFFVMKLAFVSHLSTAGEYLICINGELWLNLYLFHKENKTFLVAKIQRSTAFPWLNGFNCISLCLSSDFLQTILGFHPN